MTVQKMKEIIRNLNSCQEWALQLIRFRKISGKFAVNAHNITVTTPGALISFIAELSDIYSSDGGKLDGYQTVQEYNGSAEGTLIYQLSVSDNLIQDACCKLYTAMNHPDHGGNPLEFKANAYALKGNVADGGQNNEITLITIINPFKALKHTLQWTGDAFKSTPTKILALRSHIDVIVYQGFVYMLNMNGEKLFDMERAYKQLCGIKIEEVLSANLVTDVEAFRQHASAGFNPRKFLAFNKDRLEKLKSDSNFHRLAEQKFGLKCTGSGMFDSTDRENVNRIVKFLCGKGMIDPVNEQPVEVDGSRVWR